MLGMEKSRWGYHKLAGELKTSPGTEKAKFSQGEGKKSTWSGSSGSQLQRVSNNNNFHRVKGKNPLGRVPLGLSYRGCQIITFFKIKRNWKLNIFRFFRCH